MPIEYFYTMKYCVALLWYNLFFVYGCRQHHSALLQQPKADLTKFFPVNDFILNDINEVEQTPYYIYQITIHQNKKDSSSISVQDFKRIAALFLEKNITQPEISPQYRESVFNDLSTSSYTITYRTLNEQLPVKDVTVLLDNTSNKLKRIFIDCEFKRNDSDFIEKYFWKTGKSLQLNQLIKYNNQTVFDEQKKIVWNDAGE